MSNNTKSNSNTNERPLTPIQSSILNYLHKANFDIKITDDEVIYYITRDTISDWNFEDEYGYFPLTYAFERPKLLEFFLNEKGCNINYQNKDGETALMNFHGYSHGVKTLLNHGADPNLEDKKGETALFYCFQPPSKIQEQVSSAATLLQHAINLNHQNHKGETFLHKAAKNASTVLILERFLRLVNAYKKDINMNIVDNQGKTPLQLAKTDSMKTILSRYGSVSGGGGGGSRRRRTYKQKRRVRKYTKKQLRI